MPTHDKPTLPKQTVFIEGSDGRVYDEDEVEAFAEAVATHREQEAAALVAEMREALRIAVRQNSHDMLMTGEELRPCESALTKADAWLEGRKHG